VLLESSSCNGQAAVKTPEVYKGCGVTVQVVKTGLTPQIAPSDRLWEAETVQLHPAGPLRTPCEVLQDVALLLL
jgi:hypothetical protein